jgi:hypothetical protein
VHAEPLPASSKSPSAIPETATPKVTVKVYGPLLEVRVVADVNVGESTSTTPVTVAVADDAPLNDPEYSTKYP